MLELVTLAKKYGTDKWGQHFYATHYERHFSKFKDQSFNLLEIGVGGYGNPDAGGESLLMWRDYFPRANIVSIDICEKRLKADRIQIFQGSQTDTDFLLEVNRDAGPFKIILDDGSHVNDHVIASFNCLFPLLQMGGIYAVEDLQTSYWAPFGGNMYDLNARGTSINFLKTLIDSLNFMERDTYTNPPTYLDKHTVAAHFYHNLCFIEKGDNNERSNIAGQPLQFPPMLPDQVCEQVKNKSDEEIDAMLSMVGGFDGIIEQTRQLLTAQLGTAIVGKPHVLLKILLRAKHVEKYIELRLAAEVQATRSSTPTIEIRMTVYDWIRLLTGNLSNIAFLSGRASIADEEALLPKIVSALTRRTPLK